MTSILPSVAVLELTYRCNHACRFCSCPWFSDMLKPGQEMGIDEWKRLIETYSNVGVSQFSFTGGVLSEFKSYKEGFLLPLRAILSKRVVAHREDYVVAVDTRGGVFVYEVLLA